MLFPLPLAQPQALILPGPVWGGVSHCSGGAGSSPGLSKGVNGDPVHSPFSLWEWVRLQCTLLAGTLPHLSWVQPPPRKPGFGALTLVPLWGSCGVLQSRCWDGAEQVAGELGGVKQPWGHPSPGMWSPGTYRGAGRSPWQLPIRSPGGASPSPQTGVHPCAACPRSSKEPAPGLGGHLDPPAGQDAGCCPSRWERGAGSGEAAWGLGIAGTVRVCWQSLGLHHMWGEKCSWGNSRALGKLRQEGRSPSALLPWAGVRIQASVQVPFARPVTAGGFSKPFAEESCRRQVRVSLMLTRQQRTSLGWGWGGPCLLWPGLSSFPALSHSLQMFPNVFFQPWPRRLSC